MSDDPKDLLIEEAASAFRERNSWDRIMPSPVWMDLAPGDRMAVFERQLESRILEQALDPQCRSATVRSVLEKLGRVR